MRWAIGLLVALNLTVFLYFGVLNPSRQQAGTKLPEPEKGNLRLISEMPVRGKQPGQTVTARQGALVRPLPEPVEQGPLASPVVKPPPELAAALSNQSVAAEPMAQDNSVPPVPEVPVAAPPTPAPTPRRTPVAETSPPPQPKACWEFGNFPGASQADTVAGALPEGLDVLKRFEAEARQLIGYYVLIPSVPDLATAEQTNARLRENGFRDTWLFRSGSLRGAISLGLFSRRTNAERHAEKVRRKGFEPELREKYRGNSVYRLQLIGNDNALVRQSVERISAGTAKRIDCPSNDR